MRNIVRVAASMVVMTAGLGFAGLGAAAVAQAQPAPLPRYHARWCDGEARDQNHRRYFPWGHNGPWDPYWHKGEAQDSAS
jgi:hypothetical protein